ncbi:MAG: hypothetical protein H7838_06270 [Magnetococcus sp. DMHC-8]
MNSTLFEAAVQAAARANAAKAAEEMAWQAWLASNTDANEAAFFAANAAWLQAVKEWIAAVNRSAEAAAAHADTTACALHA